jgi:predicted DNA binding CopG/RHH family protein
MDALHAEERIERRRAVIRARASRDLCRRVKEAAQAEGMPASEFVRRAVSDRIKAQQAPGSAA